MKHKATPLVLAFLAIISGACAQAQDLKLSCTKIATSATAQKSVPNDLLTLTFYVEEQGSDLYALQAKNVSGVNSQIKALKAAGMEAAFQNQSVRPVYSQAGKLTNQWIFSGSFFVKSSDFEAMNKALPGLLKSFKLQDTSYTVSAAVKEKTLAELKGQAIEKFMTNANEVKQAFKASSVVLLDAGLQAETPEVVNMPMMAKTMDAAMVPRPEMNADAGGSANIRYTVTGTLGLNCNDAQLQSRQ